MTLGIALAFLLSGVAGRGFSLKSYSAVVSAVPSLGAKSTGVVSMVPDPTTGILQPIVALNLTMAAGGSITCVGGLRSYVGGVMQVPGYGYNAGDRRLDLFDFSQGGWPSLPTTSVSKSGPITTYTSNCSATTGCSLVNGGQVIRFWQPGVTVALNVNAQRSIPISINITNATMHFASWSFDLFDTNATTFQPDSSIYTIGAQGYAGAPPRKAPNVTTMSFYRAFDNDTFARNLVNDNAATASGEVTWLCPNPSTRGAILAQFDVTLDINVGTYTMCNRGQCLR
jgi:hypothetical protein